MNDISKCYSRCVIDEFIWDIFISLLVQSSSPSSSNKQHPPETNGPTKRPRLNSDQDSDGDQSDTELVVDEVRDIVLWCVYTCMCVCVRACTQAHCVHVHVGIWKQIHVSQSTTHTPSPAIQCTWYSRLLALDLPVLMGTPVLACW